MTDACRSNRAWRCVVVHYLHSTALGVLRPNNSMSRSTTLGAAGGRSRQSRSGICLQRAGLAWEQRRPYITNLLKQGDIMRENLMRVYAHLPERGRRDIEFQMDSPRHKCLLLELEQVIREMDEYGVGCRDSLQVLKKEAWK